MNTSQDTDELKDTDGLNMGYNDLLDNYLLFKAHFAKLSLFHLNRDYTELADYVGKSGRKKLDLHMALSRENESFIEMMQKFQSTIICALVEEPPIEIVGLLSQEHMRFLFSIEGKYTVQHDVADLLKRLVAKLLMALIGKKGSVASAWAQQLLAIFYYIGPQFVWSQVKLSKLTDVFILYCGQNLPELSIGQKFHELPGMTRAKRALSGIFQLVGLSSFGCRNEVVGVENFEIPLGFLRKLISDFRMKDPNESWDSWYSRPESKQRLQQARTATYVVNEMLSSMSDERIDILKEIFQLSLRKKDVNLENGDSIFSQSSPRPHWEAAKARLVRQHFVGCVGIILHEYISPEVWNVSIPSSESSQSAKKNFWGDFAMLRKVLIDGIRIFNSCLGEDFVSSGFLKLILLNSKVSSEAVDVLNVIVTKSVYQTVDQLMVADADNAIQSLRNQLYQSDWNHQDALRSHHTSELTISCPEVVADIAKEAKHKAELSEAEAVPCTTGYTDDEWNSLLSKLNDNRRSRRKVASIATSCLTVVIPVVVSTNEPTCLVALEIIEHVVMTLAKVEKADAREKEVASLCPDYHDLPEATDEGVDENRLLPVMNRIWPFLVACVRNNIPGLVRRCAEVVISMVNICGENFFARYFHNDGPTILKLLGSMSPNN